MGKQQWRGKKWLDFQCVLKTEPTGSTHRLVLLCTRIVKNGVVGRTMVPQGCLCPRGGVREMAEIRERD